MKHMIRQSAIATSFALLAACANAAEPDAFTPPDYAAAQIDLSTPQASAYSMMMAMYQGSTEMVDQVFAPDATLNRLRATGEVEKDGLTPWRDWVGTLEVGQANEELFNLKVEQFDRLATVWAPFVIRYEGEIVGCGVNQFVMVDYGTDDASEWRILSGIDVQAPRETCAGFKAGVGALDKN